MATHVMKKFTKLREDFFLESKPFGPKKGAKMYENLYWRSNILSQKNRCKNGSRSLFLEKALYEAKRAGSKAGEDFSKRQNH